MQASTVERLDVLVPHGPRQTVHFAPNGTMHGFGPGKIRGTIRMLFNITSLERPDIVTSQDPFLLGLLSWCIARARGAKLHIQVHTDVCGPLYARHSLGNRLRALLARFLLSRADAIRAVSTRIKSSIENAGIRTRVSVLSVYVDAEAIASAQSIDRKKRFPLFNKLVLVVARLEPEKNVAAAIRAFAEIKKAQSGAGLIILGDGSERGNLMSLVQELELEKSVEFVGSQNPFPFYKAADVLLVTSVYEGYGMAIVEALEAGCPVVSCDVGVAKEAGAIIADEASIARVAVAVLSEGKKGRLAFELPSETEYRDMWRAEIANSAIEEMKSDYASVSTTRPIIGYVGQGFIGKNYADDLEERGFTVIRYALEEPYRENKDRIKDCDIVFIAVPTPTTPETFDDSIVRSALGLVGRGKTAVIKSTVLPGLTVRLQKDFPDIAVMHSPEFLREATAAYDAAHPDRNIMGISSDTPEMRKRAEDVLAVLPRAPFNLVCSSLEAELVKYAGNSWLYVKVVYVNMLYDLVARLGAKYDVVRDALGADPRIGRSHLDPVHQSGHGGAAARGAGGHCLIKDFEALRRLYEKEVPDAYGAHVLDTLVAKNLDLLLSSGKDLDLVKGVYGDDPETRMKSLGSSGT